MWYVVFWSPNAARLAFMLTLDCMQEPLPEPTPADIAREVQMETDVFSQAPSIDRLLTMLRGLDPQKDNLADNDELQVGKRRTSIQCEPELLTCGIS